MEQTDKNMETILALVDLAEELRIRNPATLLQVARGKIPRATLRPSNLALEDNVVKEILAPVYRSTGKSGAEWPIERIQTDLIESSQNSKTRRRKKYALMLADVYTREVRAIPLTNKKPETGNVGMHQIMPKLVENERDYSIAIDLGQQISKLAEGGIPKYAAHRRKKGTNHITVLDRAIQTLKIDSAASVTDG